MASPNPEYTQRSTETLLDIATDVIRLLRLAGETVGVAESLTAGGVMAALTSVPGASAAFRGGGTSNPSCLYPSSVAREQNSSRDSMFLYSRATPECPKTTKMTDIVMQSSRMPRP